MKVSRGRKKVLIIVENLPLPFDRCVLFRDETETSVCSVYGYPVSRSKQSKGEYQSETATYRGVFAEPSVYDELGLSQDHHLVMRFHRKRAVSNDGKRFNPIHPRGVSGGGMFAWPPSFELSQDWTVPKLA